MLVKVLISAHELWPFLLLNSLCLVYISLKCLMHVVLTLKINKKSVILITTTSAVVAVKYFNW